MDPHARVVSVWYRTARLASRNQKNLTVEIIETEIRSARHEVWLNRAAATREGGKDDSPAATAYPDRARLVGDTGLLSIKRAEQKANEGGRSIPGPPDDRSNDPH